eukprot:6941757-Alexandrium_andersonii.AAC.1
MRILEAFPKSAAPEPDEIIHVLQLAQALWMEAFPAPRTAVRRERADKGTKRAAGKATGIAAFIRAHAASLHEAIDSAPRDSLDVAAVQTAAAKQAVWDEKLQAELEFNNTKRMHTRLQRIYQGHLLPDEVTQAD